LLLADERACANTACVEIPETTSRHHNKDPVTVLMSMSLCSGSSIG